MDRYFPIWTGLPLGGGDCGSWIAKLIFNRCRVRKVLRRVNRRSRSYGIPEDKTAFYSESRYLLI